MGSALDADSAFTIVRAFTIVQRNKKDARGGFRRISGRGGKAAKLRCPERSPVAASAAKGGGNLRGSSDRERCDFVSRGSSWQMACAGEEGDLQGGLGDLGMVQEQSRLQILLGRLLQRNNRGAPSRLELRWLSDQSKRRRRRRRTRKSAGGKIDRRGDAGRPENRIKNAGREDSHKSRRRRRRRRTGNLPVPDLQRGRHRQEILVVG